jgi:hypothetical protein
MTKVIFYTSTKIADCFEKSALAVRKVLAKSFLEPKAEEEDEEVKKKARQGKGKKKKPKEGAKAIFLCISLLPFRGGRKLSTSSIRPTKPNTTKS